MKTKVLISLIAIAFVDVQMASADQLKPNMLGCATIENDQQRLNCYDRIGMRLLADEVKNTPNLRSSSNDAEGVSETVAVDIKASPVEAEESLPDDLGGKQFQTPVGSEKEVLARGKVVSCKKAYDDKWFFVFESGQVWKQVDSRRRNYRSCDFQTTIKKDGIGFKMLVDGEKRGFRVKRTR